MIRSATIDVHLSTKSNILLLVPLTMQGNRKPRQLGEGKCRHCGSVEIEVSKWIYGKPEKPLYHIKIKCNECRKSYHTKRTQDTYELTKELKWKYSKNFTKLKYE